MSDKIQSWMDALDSASYLIGGEDLSPVMNEISNWLNQNQDAVEGCLVKDAEIERLKQELKDARDTLFVYRLASTQAIYDAQQFDPSLFLNTDRGVEDVMRRVLARLGEYEGANKRWHSFETVQALAKERDALQAEAKTYYANWQAAMSITHTAVDRISSTTINVNPDDKALRIAALETERDQVVAERDDCCAEATEWKSIIQRKGYDVVVLNTWRRERDQAQADARALAEALAYYARSVRTYLMAQEGFTWTQDEDNGQIARAALSAHSAKYVEAQP